MADNIDTLMSLLGAVVEGNEIVCCLCHRQKECCECAVEDVVDFVIARDNGEK